MNRFALLLVFLLALPAAAQLDNNGTIYSRFGLGQRMLALSPQAASMGGADVSLFSTSYLSATNPANWSDQFYTRFTGGFKVQSIRTTNALDAESRLTNGTIAPIQFGFPILRRKLGVGVSFAPYTRVGYRVTETGTLPATGTDPEVGFSSVIEGDGGLQELRVGLGYEITPNISVGAAAHVLFGIIKYNERTEFLETVDYLPQVQQNEETRLSGFGASFGVTAELPQIARENDALIFGASVVLPVNLDATRTQTLVQSVETDTLGAALSGSATLPLRTSVGVSYRASPRVLVALSGEYEPWAGFDSTLPFGGFTPGLEPALNDRWRIGGGLQYIPAGETFVPSFFRRVGYRVGAYAERHTAAPVTDQPIMTYAATAGLSLPSLFPGTSIDLTGEAGIRGLEEGILVRDLFYSLSVTVNFGEAWFVKRRLR